MQLPVKQVLQVRIPQSWDKYGGAPYPKHLLGTLDGPWDTDKKSPSGPGCPRKCFAVIYPCYHSSHGRSSPHPPPPPLFRPPHSNIPLGRTLSTPSPLPKTCWRQHEPLLPAALYVINHTLLANPPHTVRKSILPPPPNQNTISPTHHNQDLSQYCR